MRQRAAVAVKNPTLNPRRARTCSSFCASPSSASASVRTCSAPSLALVEPALASSSSNWSLPLPLPSASRGSPATLLQQVAGCAHGRPQAKHAAASALRVAGDEG